MTPTTSALLLRCADLGQHETAVGGGRQCPGREENRRCSCWCHATAATDRRLMERAAHTPVGTRDVASVLDLAAHLRSARGLSEAGVEAVVRLVLDLGWRQVLGHPIPPEQRVADPLLVSASTVRAFDSDDSHEADGAIEDLLSRLQEAEGRRARPAHAAPRVEEVPGV